MKIVVLLGPTGVGKTRASISLAKHLNAEIINADATQVYIETNIGVAKITEEEMEGIPHHMISLVSLNDNFTVKDYQIEGRKVLDSLIKKNKNVIIVGGSGLYIKALLYDYKFEDENEVKTYDNLTNEELKRKVDDIYKENDIHVNNRKRLVRFLSHYETTGTIIKNTEGKDKPLYDFTLIGLTAPKEQLYNYINKRVEIMICDGLIEESRHLYNENFKKVETFIGYKEFIEYFKGERELVDAVETTKKRTRNYAKRQYTWIRTQFNNVKWFETNYENFDETIEKIKSYLNSL